MALRVRKLAEEEADHLKRLSQSRTAPARQVERARIIQLAGEGRFVPAIAAQLHIGQDVVRLWLTRFNAEGLAGLEDRPRAGRPPTYTAEQAGVVIPTALTDPQTAGPAFRRWTFLRPAPY